VPLLSIIVSAWCSQFGPVDCFHPGTTLLLDDLADEVALYS